MDEVLAMFASAQREFGARVRAVDEDQWAAATPDTAWTVADLVGHLIDENRWVAPLLHGQDLESAAKVVGGFRSLPVDGGVGANLAQEWDEAAIWSADAFMAPGALDRQVALSRGATPARVYAAEIILDLTVHAWDLAWAIGYRDPLPEALVSWVYSQLSGAVDLAGSGLFEPPVAVPDSAPLIDKLVAATGRTPR
jgi:uncharacterized protein (TIGR03086 family)